ncbi:MAG: cytochrome b/b6 domain-containing protein [Hyphomicrobium sp.]|nr:cytochrome b/b6 domain-containing protein [Hyphomicrobium sp.]
MRSDTSRPGGDAPDVERSSVAAWDAPTRIFHWSLVILIVSAWATFQLTEVMGDPRLTWHRWNGLLLLTLIVWRLLWGIAGPPHARFASFLKGPGAIAGYLRDLAAGRPRRFLGHNPAGGLMVVSLIALVATIGSLGLFAVEHNDLATGPLYRLVGNDIAKVLTGWHRFLFEPVLIALVVLHIGVNVTYTFVKRDPLIPAMITGRKPAADYEDAGALAPMSAEAIRFRAFGCLALASAIVFGGLTALGGRLPPWPKVGW